MPTTPYLSNFIYKTSLPSVSEAFAKSGKTPTASFLNERTLEVSQKMCGPHQPWINLFWIQTVNHISYYFHRMSNEYNTSAFQKTFISDILFELVFKNSVIFRAWLINEKQHVEPIWCQERRHTVETYRLNRALIGLLNTWGNLIKTNEERPERQFSLPKTSSTSLAVDWDAKKEYCSRSPIHDCGIWDSYFPLKSEKKSSANFFNHLSLFC